MRRNRYYLLKRLFALRLLPRRLYDQDKAFLARKRVRPAGSVIMSTARISGLALIGVGVVLVVIGIVASRSFADSLATTFLGRLTKNTLWYFIGGGASLVLGIILAAGARGRGAT
jgi:hypothetical protein